MNTVIDQNTIDAEKKRLMFSLRLNLMPHQKLKFLRIKTFISFSPEKFLNQHANQYPSLKNDADDDKDTSLVNYAHFDYR